MRLSPTRQTATAPNRLEPLVVLATLTVLDLIYLFLAWWSVNIVSSYGWTLFVILPFFFGVTVAVLGRWMGYRALDRCLFLAFAALGIAGSIALLIGFEGAICILMASPLILFLTVIGCWVGTKILPSAQRTRTLGAMLILTPFLMAFEAAIELEPALFVVRTTVEVDAPPEVVWRHVVSFSEIPEPEGWLFKTGLAYPLRARIEGSGVGAIRYCEFSTGPFVEPIEVWDEPRLLRFTVSDNPPPMREWNPFHEVHPPHLDNFLVSRRGQFLLEPLPGGRTRLEGTTWYQHGLWPATYWSWWSQAIIHRIHERVLDHVRQLAETDRYPASSELLCSQRIDKLRCRSGRIGLSAVVAEDVFDLLTEKTSDSEGQRKAGIVFSGLDGVDRLPRNFELVGQSRLRPVVLGAQHFQSVLHPKRLCPSTMPKE